MPPLKQLGVQLNQLAQSYQQAGNSTSAQNTLQLDLQLGQQLSATDAQPLITTLVGMAVEKIALSSMDPTAPYGNTGQTVQDQIDQLTQQRQYIRDITAQFETLSPSMSDQDILSYHERRRTFGEPSAMQWIVGNTARSNPFAVCCCLLYKSNRLNFTRDGRRFSLSWGRGPG